MNLIERAARFFGYAKYRHVPPGHFYSPIPDIKEVLADKDRIFDRTHRTFPGIDLREEEQLKLLRALSRNYPELPFPREKQPEFRYYYNNDFYGYTDAVFLYLIMRHFQPKRIVEVGSGHSTCLILDTNERFFSAKIQLDLIEPNPERLDGLLFQSDRAAIRLHQQKLQAMPLQFFRDLDEGDILFIDSTHVSRIGSDVNYYLFEILPVLKPGVLIHIHDISMGFEYPQEWIEAGIAWSENYLLRAFLQYNSAFQIILFNTFLQHFHRPYFLEHMPLCLERGGGCIWLQKGVRQAA